jgi:hypothetical protein
VSRNNPQKEQTYVNNRRLNYKLRAVSRKKIFHIVTEPLTQPTSLHSRTQPLKKISNQLFLFNVAARGTGGVEDLSPLAKLERRHREGVAITT